MVKYKPFLLWWIIFITSIAGFVVAAEYDLITKMWSLDISKISFLILSAYLLSSGYCGWVVFNIKKSIEKHLSNLWFISNIFIRLGLIGTVIGFMLAFSEILVPTGSFSTSDIKALIEVISGGLAVAFITTLVGLICSAFLQIQLVIVEYFYNV